MKRLFLLFGLLMGGTTMFAQNGSISAIVNGNTVTIWHTNTERNCGSAYEMLFTIEDKHLDIYEKDTGAIANCFCHFDLSIIIDSLASGNYTTDVYGIEIGNSGVAEDTVYYGNTNFTISGGESIPYRLASFQSICHSNAVEENPAENRLLIFPNPVADKISIRLPENLAAKSGRFDVYDSYGRQVASSVFTSEALQNIEWDTKDLVPGVYFYRLQWGNRYFYGKFVVGSTKQ